MSFASTPRSWYVSFIGAEKTVSLVRTYTSHQRQWGIHAKYESTAWYGWRTRKGRTSENANLSATSLVHSNRRVSWRVNLRTETGTVVTFASWPASLSHKVITWDQQVHVKFGLKCVSLNLNGFIIWSTSWVVHARGPANVRSFPLMLSLRIAINVSRAISW